MALPSGIQVFERGWLSSNNVLLTGAGQTALIDSGYCTHSAQTVDLVRSALGSGRGLDLLLNTHLHSDHCGGNAALQQAYPSLTSWIAPGQAADVTRWDLAALSFDATGQACPQFHYEETLIPASSMDIAGQSWQVHAAGGHDPHSVIFFQPDNGVLISADALWEQGFGIVFPELDGVGGVAGFDGVAKSLDLIESLSPAMVIPGHGQPFADFKKALAFARSRLRYFKEQPVKHLQYAAKVLLKFKLLELQRCTLDDLLRWMDSTPYLGQVGQMLYPSYSPEEVLDALVDSLVKSGAATRHLNTVENSH